MGEALRDVDDDMHDKHLLDTGLTCAWDGDVIEYTDLVIIVLMITPGLVSGPDGTPQLMFYDIMTGDQDDYLYEPNIFHGKNWDEIEEQFRTYVKDHYPIEVPGSILNCAFCKSGILPGETTGVALVGEVHRSQRNPDLQVHGNHFEPLNKAPDIICVSCMMEINNDIHELWPDGVCHDEECPEGTFARCWRDGCPGNCQNNNPE
jgi:hypothetical protein